MLYYHWLEIKKCSLTHYLMNEDSCGTQAKNMANFMHQISDLSILPMRYENSVLSVTAHHQGQRLQYIRNIRPMTNAFILIS